MKKIKIFLVLIFVTLLSGCSGVYNLKINDNLSIDESVNLKINYNEESYDKAINLFKENNISEDDYSIVVNDNSMEIEYKNSYDSVEDYLINSKLYSQLFPNIDYANDNNKLLLNTNSVFSNNVKLLNINVETPFNVTDNNADDKNENIYTWSINSSTGYKEINLEIDLDNKKNKNIYILLIVFTTIILLLPIIHFLSKYIKSRKM